MASQPDSASRGCPRFAADSTGDTGRAVLAGREFDLAIGELPVDFTGAMRTATVVNGQLPAPLLRWRQGDTVTLRVRNTLPVRSSIHWHGIILPADMDGVPGPQLHGHRAGRNVHLSVHGEPGGHVLVSQPFAFPGAGRPVRPDRDRAARRRAFSGRSRARRAAVGLDGRRSRAHLRDAEEAERLLQFRQADRRRISCAMRARKASRNALAERRMWNQMRMDPTDLADVSALRVHVSDERRDAARATGPALFARGEKVRLRFINGSSMTFFDVRIPGLKFTVVAADGQDIEPVTVDEFRIAPAETCDVIVEPSDDRAYTIFAQAMDRSGYARGTLAPRAGMEAEVPPLDPRATADDARHDG